MFKLILISCLNAQTYAKSYLIEMQETKNSTDYQGKDLKRDLKQEWSSMESSSYENWDKIEMLFVHLDISYLQLVIGNR